MRVTSRNPKRALLGIALILTVTQAFAQDQTSISGKVADSKGVPIPGAGVTVSSNSGKLAEVITELDGSFAVDGLPAGIYQLAVEIAGFLKNVNEKVDTSADSSRSMTIKLEPVPRPSPAGQVRASGAKQVLQADPAQALEVPSFQAAQVTSLPGLNQFQQALTQPGDSNAAGTGSTSSRQDNLLFISGNTASVDAGNMNDPGFRDMMMDAARQMGFQLQQFGPMGEAGPGGAGGMGAMGGVGGIGGGPGGGGPPGGGMGFVGIGGRGGRGMSFKQPAIEGNLSETYSNSALNARNYSLSGQTLDKPVQIQNNFGLTLGGVLPFFKNRAAANARGPGRMMGIGGKPGWQFSYSGSRNRSALDVLTTVPTDLERAGDFSQSYTQALVTDPLTGQRSVAIQPIQLYANPNDPSTRFTNIFSIDPIARGLLKYIPRANLPCARNGICVNNYALERSLPTTSNQFQISVTGLRPTTKDSFGLNYSMRRGNSLNAATFQGLDTTRSNSAQNAGISGIHNFQSRLTGEWRITINRVRTESANEFAYRNNVEQELEITGISQDPINWGPPTISFTNYGNLSLAAPSFSQNQTFSISGGVNKIGIKHSIRTGIDITWSQRNSKSDSNGRGTYTFNGYATVLLDADGNQLPGTGNDFADFLLGLPYSTSRRYVDSAVNPYGNAIYLRNRNWNIYVQDNWRLGSNLTLNYGLRYEYTGPSFEKYDRLVSLDASSDFTRLAQAFPKQKGPITGHSYSRSIVEPDWNNFAPRIGIAWRPKPGSPVVIRAGYGVGYNTGGYGSIVNQLINQAPYAVTQNLSSDRARPLTLREGFPDKPELTILNTFAIDSEYKAAYAQQWTLDIQTQLSKLYVLNIGYSGSKGTGLDLMRAPNRSSSTSQFIYQTNGGSSIYHGLNVQVMRRFSHGFNITGSYTLSKSIDDSSGSVAQNDADLAAERGLSSSDQRHNFQTNFTYELPIGQNRRFFSNASAGLLNFISGWAFNGSVNLASGTPLTARYAGGSGASSGAALYNSLRPDVTGERVDLSRSERTWQKYFNTAAFAMPGAMYGNAGRNTIAGPGTYLVNLSVRKGFRLDENNRRIDFGWQIQNLLNHPNWGGVSTTINSLNFGQVTSVRSMRSMSMNLRVRF